MGQQAVHQDGEAGQQYGDDAEDDVRIAGECLPDRRDERLGRCRLQ
jgi:hypothetical protein